MPRQHGIVQALRAQGLTVKVVKGHKTRGSSSFAPFAHLNHWTAGPRSGDRPSLNVCINGRPKVPGPLCNTFLPRGLTAEEKVVYVVADGRANHAGRGSYRGATGNTDLFGTEVEWDGSKNGLTEFQLWALPRINAAYRSLGSRFDAGHDEYALPRGRKIDIGSHMDIIRKRTSEVLAGLQPTATIPAKELATMELSDRISVIRSGKESSITVGQHFANQDANTNTIINLLGDVKDLLTNVGTHRGGERVVRTMPQSLEGIDGRAVATHAELAGLTEMVSQLAVAGGATIDYDRVTAAAQVGAEKAIGDGLVFDLTVTRKEA